MQDQMIVVNKDGEQVFVPYDESVLEDMRSAAMEKMKAVQSGVQKTKQEKVVAALKKSGLTDDAVKAITAAIMSVNG